MLRLLPFSPASASAGSHNVRRPLKPQATASSSVLLPDKLRFVIQILRELESRLKGPEDDVIVTRGAKLPEAAQVSRRGRLVAPKLAFWENEYYDRDKVSGREMVLCSSVHFLRFARFSVVAGKTAQATRSPGYLIRQHLSFYDCCSYSVALLRKQDSR